MWHGIAEAVPDRDALVCGERRVSWAELDTGPRWHAAHLWSVGLRPGDKVAIDLTNRPEYVEAFYAAVKLGGVPVNVNYRYGVDEVRYVLDNCDAKAVIHDPEFADVGARGHRRSRPPIAAASRPAPSTKPRSRAVARAAWSAPHARR